MKTFTWKSSAAIIAAALMLTASLTGCSGKSGPDSESGNTAAGSSGIEKIVNAGKIKVGVKIDVPNFGFLNPQTNQMEGMEVDLAYIIAGKIFDCTAEEAKEKKLVDFTGVNAKTRGPLLDNGEIDLVIATFTITPERLNSWNFSTPYYTDAVGLLVKKDSGINSILDLNGKVIGIAKGANSKDGLLNYVKENNLDVSLSDGSFEEFDTYPELAAALASNNIDVFCVDRAILAGYNDDTTIILEDRFAEQAYGVVSSKANTDLSAFVESVVIDMKDSGELDTLLKTWGIE